MIFFNFLGNFLLTIHSGFRRRFRVRRVGDEAEGVALSRAETFWVGSGKETEGPLPGAIAVINHDGGSTTGV